MLSFSFLFKLEDNNECTNREYMIMNPAWIILMPAESQNIVQKRFFNGGRCKTALGPPGQYGSLGGGDAPTGNSKELSTVRSAMSMAGEQQVRLGCTGNSGSLLPTF